MKANRWWAGLVVLSLSMLLLTGCFSTRSSELSEGESSLSVEPTQMASMSSAQTDDASVEESPGQFSENECPFELFPDDPIVCGTLVVPQNRQESDGLEVELAVAILASRSATPQPDPILYLEGGPGGSALIDPDSWLDSPLRDDRTIILLDQRGTGFSWPNLACPEENEAEGDDPLDATLACRDRLLDQGVDLTQYNSAASAADIEDLRVALGYDEWNLLGVSYGTRLALTVMRDFPQGVRSTVLDSVYPPNVNAYSEEAGTSVDAIFALIDGCSADGACSAAYPTLEDDLLALLDTLEESPISLDDGEPVDAANFVDLLVNSLYDTDAIASLPRLIDETHNGNSDLLTEFLLGPDDGGERRLRGRLRQDEPESLEDSQGVFYSVECHEEVPFSDLGEAEEGVAGVVPQLAYPLLDSVRQIFDTCEFWGAGVAEEIENQAVVSAIPTLLLAGEYDPVTPPSWARLAGESLTNHYYVELSRGGHGLIDAGDCFTGIIAGFLDTPNQAPDQSCISGAVRAFETQ